MQRRPARVPDAGRVTDDRKPLGRLTEATRFGSELDARYRRGMDAAKERPASTQLLEKAQLLQVRHACRVRHAARLRAQGRDRDADAGRLPRAQRAQRQHAEGRQFKQAIRQRRGAAGGINLEVDPTRP